MSDELSNLVGKTILGVFIGGHDHVLSFVTPDAVLTFLTWAECCNDVWFADVTGVDALLNATVQSVETISMDGYNVDDGRAPEGHGDDAYGHRIITDKGYAVIVYRNSNDHISYGGGLYGVDDDDDFNLPSDMVQITEDWTGSPGGREYHPNW